MLGGIGTHACELELLFSVMLKNFDVCTVAMGVACPLVL